MAEKVVFRGGEFDGIQVENAASEATLQLILESLSKIPGGSKKQQRIQDLYNRAVERGTDSLDDNTDEVKRSTSAFSKFGSAVGSVSYGMGAFAGAVTDAALKLWSFKGYFDEYLTQFRRVSMAGVDLGESLFSTASIAADARMNMETFSNALNNNSLALAALGGNATRGAMIFADITKGMNRSGIQQKFMQLGYDMVEIGDATAGYLEIQTKLGRAQKMDSTQLQRGTEQYLMQLDKLSRITGLNRKEAEKMMRAQANDKRLQALMANMDEGARTALAGVSAAIEGQAPDLAEVMKELVATGGIPISDLGKSVAMQVPALQDYARRLREGSITQEEVIDGIRREAQARGKLTAAEEEVHAMLVSLGKESPYAARVLLQSMTNFGKGAEEAGKAQIKAMEDNQKIAAGIDQMLQSIKSTFISAFIDTGLLDAITVGVTTFIKGMGEVLTALDLSSYAKIFTGFFKDFVAAVGEIDTKGFAESLKGLTPDTILPKISELISDLIKPLTEELKDELISALKVGLGIAIAGLFVSAAAQVAISKGIDKLFGGGGGPSLPGGSGGGRSGGRGLPNMGSATGGTLTGIANGIGAFANPKVALGAAAMGAAIALIGAGIAGASWIMGKALPTLSEGVKSFETVDGEKLTLAGDGMVTLAKGLAAIAGGSLVQGLTAPLTAMTDAIGDFFGADSPIEKLQKFAQSDFDYEKVNKNADALSAFGTAVGTLNDFSFNGADSLELIEDLSPRKIEQLARSFEKFANSAQKVANLNFANLSVLPGGFSNNPNAATPSNPSSSLSTSNVKTVELLSGIKEAITNLSEDLNVLKPADNSQIVNNTRDQNQHLISLQEQIKMLNSNISELLIVQRKAHNIDRRTLEAVKQNSNYL